MRRRNSIINAAQSLYDENVELKQRLAALTAKTKNGEGQSVENRFTILCYEKGLKEIEKLLDRRFNGYLNKNKDGSYYSYEQWLHGHFEGYGNNPFDENDTRFLLKEFSINDLLKALDSWLRAIYQKLVENQRLNDLPKEK